MMTGLNRADMEARYTLFQTFALEDQRNYYEVTLKKFRSSSSQVNRYRAAFAFLTGVTSALATYLVQFTLGAAPCSTSSFPGDCTTIGTMVGVLIVLSVVMPALGAFFNTLADLYQWDRATTIYESAVENLVFADAQSPIQEMEDPIYRASLMAYADGTLQVMSDESAQWGQSIRTPPQTNEFIEQMTKEAEKYNGAPPPSRQEPPSNSQ